MKKTARDAGKKTKEAATATRDGLVLIGLKSERVKLTKEYEHCKEKHQKHKSHQNETTVMLALIASNDQHKIEYLTKLSLVPVDNVISREVFEKIIETLTIANESLTQILPTLKSSEVEVEVFTDEDLERETLEYEKKMKETNDQLTKLRAKVKNRK